MTTGKNVNVDAEIQRRLKDYAWQKRVSVSVVVQGIVADYANGVIEAPPVTSDESVTMNVKYNKPPEYEAALARAKTDGVPLTDVIRFHLGRLLME